MNGAPSFQVVRGLQVVSFGPNLWHVFDREGVEYLGAVHQSTRAKRLRWYAEEPPSDLSCDHRSDTFEDAVTSLDRGG